MTVSVQSDSIICCILLAFVLLGGHSDPPGTFQGGGIPAALMQRL